MGGDSKDGDFFFVKRLKLVGGGGEGRVFTVIYFQLYRRRGYLFYCF